MRLTHVVCQPCVVLQEGAIENALQAMDRPERPARLSGVWYELEADRNSELLEPFEGMHSSTASANKHNDALRRTLDGCMHACDTAASGGRHKSTTRKLS